MQRYGQVIRIKPEHIEEYESLHRAAWPEVLAMIRECNIRNYSIYRYDHLLFAYFEYDGADFDADMEAVAEDPITQQWWRLTDPCQEPMPDAVAQGSRWTTMEQVFLME